MASPNVRDRSTPTIAPTATTLRNTFGSKMRLKSSSKRDGWVYSFDASLKQEKIGQGCCHSQKRQEGRPSRGVINITPRRSDSTSQRQNQEKHAPN
ncbi:hypothetical protein COCNU_07G015050 [Cocos nucifera]|uniref:Uncharacterized protein n=1 Tax=Cocos nucifera TaxID=13894 RepID=A0A8K0IHS9_COCNU|nr:hypothetical protein COCNU_07G015050 [Cocos nucifera]